MRGPAQREKDAPGSACRRSTSCCPCWSWSASSSSGSGAPGRPPPSRRPWPPNRQNHDTPTATATATPTPRATFEVAPTATPLYSPTPPPTATLPPNQTRHTVASGETVSTIAKLYGTTIKAILEANGLKSNTILSVGQELIIPLPIANTSTPTPTLTPSPTPFVYTIRTADTLSAIAKKYKTTVEALMDANGIVDATRIRVGTKIMIVQPPDYSSTMAYEIYEVSQGDTLISISGQVQRHRRRDQRSQRTDRQQPERWPGTKDPGGHRHPHADPDPHANPDPHPRPALSRPGPVGPT